MKTILHVIETTGPGGAETIFIQLAAGGPGRRFRNLAALPGSGWVADSLAGAGITCVRVPMSRTPVVFDNGLFAGLVRLIRQFDVDLVQSHCIGIGVYACLAGLRTRTPVVCTLHGEVDLGRTARYRGIKLAILKWGASRIVLVSNHLREKLLVESRIPADRTVVVYNGVDCDEFSGQPDRTFRRELGIAEDILLFGAIGNVRPPKAYDTLLRAAAIAVRSNPNLRFAVVGEGSGALLDELLRLRTELGLHNIVQFAGFCQDVTVPLRNFDAFVLSSRSEGFPLTVLQAMAAGLPVVATRCGGPEEQITDGVDGLLVPREDPASLAAAMLRLAGDAELRRELGSAARAAARAKFSLTKMLDSYEEIYLAALGLKNPSPGR